MGKTKKVGTTGRFGPRYGSRIRKRLADIEQPMKQLVKCPKCETKAVKRLSVGVWACKKCGAVFTGGAYTMHTQPGVESRRSATRIQHELEKVEE